MKNGIVALVALAGIASGASATNTWLVDVTYSNVLAGAIVNAGDTAIVTISAQFDDNLYAFAGGAFNVNTSEDADGSWSLFGRDIKGPGTNDGTAVGGDVNGIITGQLQFPIAGIFAKTDNPILAWHGTFTTNDLSPHVVTLDTVTAKFDAYLDQDLDGDGFADGTSESELASLIEGHADIQVGVPAPGAAALLGLGALAAGRRRR